MNYKISIQPEAEFDLEEAFKTSAKNVKDKI